MDQIKKVYETNVFGLIRMTQAVIPGMKAKKSGHIINVASILGLGGKVNRLMSEYKKYI